MSRNILAPSLMPMGNNRCYRLNVIHDDFQDQLPSQRSVGKRVAGNMAYIEPGGILLHYNVIFSIFINKLAFLHIDRNL